MTANKHAQESWGIFAKRFATNAAEDHIFDISSGEPGNRKMIGRVTVSGSRLPSDAERIIRLVTAAPELLEVAEKVLRHMRGAQASFSYGIEKMPEVGSPGMFTFLSDLKYLADAIAKAKRTDDCAEPPEPSDSAHCWCCGCEISDADHDDNGGRCDECCAGENEG